MGKDEIQITIINDSRVKECEAECGMDWSSPEAIPLANRRIKERFGDKGDKIGLVYLDLSKEVTNSEALEWNEAVKNRNLMLPLLLTNGQLRTSGQFDIRQLLDVIEAEIEIGAER